MDNPYKFISAKLTFGFGNASGTSPQHKSIQRFGFALRDVNVDALTAGDLFMIACEKTIERHGRLSQNAEATFWYCYGCPKTHHADHDDVQFTWELTEAREPVVSYNTKWNISKRAQNANLSAVPQIIDKKDSALTVPYVYSRRLLNDEMHPIERTYIGVDIDTAVDYPKLVDYVMQLPYRVYWQESHSSTPNAVRVKLWVPCSTSPIDNYEYRELVKQFTANHFDDYKVDVSAASNGFHFSPNTLKSNQGKHMFHIEKDPHE